MQRAPAGRDVLVLPEDLVVGHRFAPVGHGEIAIDLLSAEECGVGLLVFEIVEGGDAGAEFAFSRGRHGDRHTECRDHQEHPADHRVGGEAERALAVPLRAL